MPLEFMQGGRGTLPPPKPLRERVGALRNLPPFLALVWQTSPTLASATLLLRLVRAVLPVATLHEELLEQRRHYAELFELQAAGYR